MLQILQSPMGAALIPQMHQRENLIMDRGNADLQEVISRTGIAQDENRRAADMHPLRLQGTRLDNEGKELGNADARFKGQVRDTLGVDHAVRKEQNAATLDDLKIAEAGMKNFSTIAGIIDGSPDAPGARRALAIEMVGKYKLPSSMIDTLSQMPEEQIGPTFRAMAENAAKFTRQAYIADQANATRRDIAQQKNLTDIEIAKIRADAQRDAARMVAEAKKRSGGNPREEKYSMEQLYSKWRMIESDPNASEEMRAYAGMVAQRVYEDIQGKPATAGAVGTTLQDQGPGKSPKLGTAPRNPPRPTAPLPSPPLPASQNPTAPTKANAAKLPQAQPVPGIMSAEDYLNKYNPQKR